MKNRIAIVLIALILLMSFAGCSRQGNAGTPAVASKSELAPATIQFWFPSEGEVNDTYFTEAAKEFELKYPQIKVEVTKLPTAAADVDLKLNAAVLSNDFPDVLSAYLNLIPARGSRDEFADLGPYITKWDEKEDVVQSAWTMGMYKGKQIGIGFYPAPEILVYRTDYFLEAGLDPAIPPKNWDELKEYAYKLVKKDSSGKVIRAGLDVPSATAHVFFRPFMRQAGSNIVDEINGKPDFTDKGAISAFEFLASLSDQAIPYDGNKRDDYPFMKGMSAMGVINVSQIAKLYATDPAMKDKLAFAPVLQNVKKVDFCGYRLFTMGVDTKYGDQSWEFIKFLMSKEQNIKRAQALNIPIVRSSLEQEYIAMNPKVNTAIVEYVKYGKGAESVPWVQTVLKYLSTAFEETSTKKKSAEQALKDADKAVNNELQTILKN